MSYETILVETTGAVTLVTLNRPQALNALNTTVLKELIDAFAAYDADSGQRCLVLTGSEKAFAAGAEEGDEWARLEAETIRRKSPMACKVTLKLLVESPYQLHFVDEMRMEYGIMVRLIHHPDFKEGVRALLIDKDNAPQWRPTNPHVIGDRDVEAFFEPLPPEEQWRPFDF